jgi:hypothetical protein
MTELTIEESVTSNGKDSHEVIHIICASGDEQDEELWVEVGQQFTPNGEHFVIAYNNGSGGVNTREPTAPNLLQTLVEQMDAATVAEVLARCGFHKP